MIVYMSRTDSLGDFLSGLPVLKGLHDSYGKLILVIKHTNRKFKGMRELLQYQDLFSSVHFDDEVRFANNNFVDMHIPDQFRETSDSPIRPEEVCRFENSIRDKYDLKFEVDDNFEIKYPEINVDFDRNIHIAGDRWFESSIDRRRAVNILSHLKNVMFLDYNNDLLTNCYIIKNSNKPFIAGFTGCAVLGNLLNKEMYVVWKKEDFAPQYWQGENVIWDWGKDIEQTFKRHFYTNRNCKLIHDKDLHTVLK